jgi:cystathionine beta-lyase
MQKQTACVHSGTILDPVTRGLNSPIYTSSSYQYIDRDENVYPRYFNTPNQAAVVKKLCELEGAEDGLLFSSGMAAITTVLLSFLNSGDHAVLQRDIYGGTHHFITAEFERFGIEFSFASNESEAITASFRNNTKLVYIETPSNPLLAITDIKTVAGAARDSQVISVIDNTFASPIHQNPLARGIDVVVHSGTKYLGGHSDLCCGAVLSSKGHLARIRSSAANFGGSLNAWTCALLERSLKTLAVRMEKQTRNAAQLAAYLQNRPEVVAVYYPGLENHPDHAVAKSQMTGFGAMLAFELDESRVRIDRFLKRLNLVTPALSLGGVETIICAPKDTSHAKVSAAERAQMGISDSLLRLSVGIEAPEDLMADLGRALGD